MQNKMICEDKTLPLQHKWMSYGGYKKYFTNEIYGENPVRKQEMASWQNIFFQLENFYFPTEKLFFSNWALFFSFLNVFLCHFWFLFDHFLFIFAHHRNCGKGKNI